MPSTGLRALCAFALTGVLSATAIAAEPDKGTVSADAPKVTWLGQVSAGSYLTSRLMILADATGNGGEVPCEQGCDRFTLTVGTKKDLTIAADSPADPAEPGQTVIRVTKPDGSYLTTVGETTEGKPLSVKFKNADTGDYLIDISDNYANEHEYAGSASLSVPPPAAAPAAPGTAPAPAPGQPAPSTSTQGQNIDLAIKPGKASAKKLKRSGKLPVTVTVSRPVAKITAFLRSGKKTIGTGKLGATNGTAKLPLKVSKKKIKKGNLTLTVVADDGKGTTATKTVKVKVAK